MINQGKLGPAEAVVLLAITMSSRVFLPWPRYLFEIGANAAWLTPVGGLLVALLGVFMINKLLAKNPGKNIAQITEDTLGPYLGTAVNLIYVLFFLFVSLDFTRVFSEAMITAALSQTPISVITLGFLAVSLLGAYLGIEAMARTARLTYPFIFIGVIVLLASLYPLWNLHNLFPILGNGPYNVFALGTFSTAAVTEIILLGVFANVLGGHKYTTKIGINMVLLSFGFLILLLFVTSLTYNWSMAQEFTLPFHRVARVIYLGRFFQRVEAIYIIIWSFFAIAKIALTLYAAAFVLAQVLKLPYYRPLIWPLGMVVFTSSLLPPDLPAAVGIDNVILRPAAWLPSYIIPAILLLILSFKERGKGAG